MHGLVLSRRNNVSNKTVISQYLCDAVWYQTQIFKNSIDGVILSVC